MEKIDIKRIENGFVNPEDKNQINALVLAEKLNELIEVLESRNKLGI